MLGDFELQFIIIKLQQNLVQKKKKIFEKIIHLPFTWQLAEKRLVGVFHDLIFSFSFWKPVAAKKSKERSRIFGPGEVASKIGKRCGVVLDSHSLH